MNIGRILFLAIFLLSTSTIVAGGSFAQRAFDYAAAAVLSSQPAEFQAAQVQLDLKNKYQQLLLKVLADFSDHKISYDELQEKLLGLIVPKDYQELHFNLITSLVLMRDQESKAPAARARLEKLKATYNWLAKNLTYIISNNF